MKKGKSGRKKWQEHKEGRARHGGRRDKTTMKKGQEQDELNCKKMKKGQERARMKGGQEGRNVKKEGRARRKEGQ